MPSPENSSYRNPWNPENRRPDGPIKIQLSAREARMLVTAYGNHVSEHARAMMRETETGGAHTSGGPAFNAAESRRFKNEVLHLLGEGENGLEVSDLETLKRALREEAMLVALGNQRFPSDVGPTDIKALMEKLGAD